MIGDSWDSTYDSVWGNTHWDGHYATESALLVPRVGATPVVFTCKFFRRAFLYYDKEEERRSKQSEQDRQKERDELSQQVNQSLTQAREFYSEKKYTEAVTAIDKILCLRDYRQTPLDTRQETALIYMKSLLRTDAPDRLFDCLDKDSLGIYAGFRMDDELTGLFEETFLKGSLTRKSRIIYCLVRYIKDADNVTAILLKALDDPDPVIRYIVLDMTIKAYGTREHIAVQVMKKASQDSHEVIRGNRY